MEGVLRQAVKTAPLIRSSSTSSGAVPSLPAFLPSVSNSRHTSAWQTSNTRILRADRCPPKKKMPWIELNGEAVADSQFCIDFLNKKFDVNLNKSLTAKEIATAYAFRKLADESLYWFIVLYRWVFRVNQAWLEEAKIPRLMRWFVCRMAPKQCWAQGYGRHTREEVDGLMEGDLGTISEYLGNKDYMMGSEPTELDCVMFGQLSQFRWNLHGSLANTLVTEKFSNLSSYCERMKERYWPDWEDCITRGGKR